MNNIISAFAQILCIASRTSKVSASFPKSAAAIGCTVHYRACGGCSFPRNLLSLMSWFSPKIGTNWMNSQPHRCRSAKNFLEQRNLHNSINAMPHCCNTNLRSNSSVGFGAHMSSRRTPNLPACTRSAFDRFR